MELKINNLRKVFGDKVVLDDVNYEFESGKIYGLLGRNGAGKTTFFNCLNEDVLPDLGVLMLNKDGEEKPLVPEDIGYVLSTPVVPDFLTATEFLNFFISVNQSAFDSPPTADALLDFIGIDKDDRHKLLKDFSHGMKNKIQMLVNIAARPSVLLLDEPLTSFDVIASEEMKNTLRRIKNEHIIIFSTHIMELALDLCDEIVVLNGGRLQKIDKDGEFEITFKERIIAALKGDVNE